MHCLRFTVVFPNDSKIRDRVDVDALLRHRNGRRVGQPTKSRIVNLLRVSAVLPALADLPSSWKMHDGESNSDK